MSEWINVDDALPDSSEDNVLVYNDLGAGSEPDIARFDKRTWEEDKFIIFRDMEGGSLRFVTHWMQLPEVPHG